jgi:hypothetical protein
MFDDETSVDDLRVATTSFRILLLSIPVGVLAFFGGIVFLLKP